MISVKKFRIHIKYFGLLVLLSAICTIISCDNSNKPMPFDKEEWVECGTFDGYYSLRESYYVNCNTRYRMSLWLKQNYNFCDKSLNNILEKFYITEYFNECDSLYIEQIKNDKILKMTTKRYYPPRIMNIDPPIHTDWIEIHFDENYMVSKVYYVHYDYKTEKKTKREICNAA